jgi:hypothetical protein
VAGPAPSPRTPRFGRPHPPGREPSLRTARTGSVLCRVDCLGESGRPRARSDGARSLEGPHARQDLGDARDTPPAPVARASAVARGSPAEPAILEARCLENKFRSHAGRARPPDRNHREGARRSRADARGARPGGRPAERLSGVCGQARFEQLGHGFEASRFCGASLFWAERGAARSIHAAGYLGRCRGKEDRPRGGLAVGDAPLPRRIWTGDLPRFGALVGRRRRRERQRVDRRARERGRSGRSRRVEGMDARRRRSASARSSRVAFRPPPSGI